MSMSAMACFMSPVNALLQNLALASDAKGGKLQEHLWGGTHRLYPTMLGDSPSARSDMHTRTPPSPRHGEHQWPTILAEGGGGKALHTELGQSTLHGDLASHPNPWPKSQKDHPRSQKHHPKTEGSKHHLPNDMNARGPGPPTTQRRVSCLARSASRSPSSARPSARGSGCSASCLRMFEARCWPRTSATSR